VRLVHSLVGVCAGSGHQDTHNTVTSPLHDDIMTNAIGSHYSPHRSHLTQSHFICVLREQGNVFGRVRCEGGAFATTHACVSPASARAAGSAATRRPDLRTAPQPADMADDEVGHHHCLASACSAASRRSRRAPDRHAHDCGLQQHGCEVTGRTCMPLRSCYAPCAV
jgi:hypothetical protein